MGMAASQARYLELTARKTDVEFQGQQINQQRTELATQSAGLFTQLMGLSVPTPPSTTDFTTTDYSFSDGSNNYTISSVRTLNGDPNYNSIVSYYSTQSIYTGVGRLRNDLGVNIVGPTYWLTDGGTPPTNKTKLTQCTLADPNYGTDVKAIEQIITDTGAATSFATDYNGGTGLGNTYKYTATNGTTYYYGNTELNTLAGQGGAAGNLDNYYATNLDKKINATENAYITKTDDGRYSSIKLASESATLDVATKSITDQNAYQDAMNEFEFKQQQYQQEVNNANAKTSIIQAQDRTLELKLKQLDTEQEALSTEMESVKKVIDKNIEQTFKTFQ